MGMFNKKKIIRLNKLNILIILFFVFIAVLPFTFSKFETVATSNITVEQAIYLLDARSESITVKLPEIVPSNNQYSFTFSIANNDGRKRSETSLKYDMEVITTTNIPITYDLFDTLDVTNATSIINENNVIADDYGTYFRHITTDTKYFGIDEDEINYYTLLITLPAGFNDSDYRALFEMIEIKIDSSQVITGDDI